MDKTICRSGQEISPHEVEEVLQHHPAIAQVTPRTPTETRLAEIWARVLGLERVDVHDDFLEIGGDSIMAIQILSRVREEFGVEAIMMPTIAMQSEHIDQALSKQGLAVPAESATLRHTENEPVILSFAQERLWFLAQLEPDNTAYVRSMLIRLTGGLHAEALQQSLTELVRRHESLRTAMPSMAGQPAPYIAPPEPVALPVIDLSGLSLAVQQDRARQLAKEESFRLVDLAQTPLLRAMLLRLDRDEHILLLTTHHIVTDAWSDSIMWREIAALYDAFSQGQDSPLPELAVQYTDYARAQRRFLQGETIEKMSNYWRQQLSDTPKLMLPIDHPRQLLRTERGGRYTMTLPIDLSKAVESFSRREGVTLFMTLLAAFSTLLHRYTDQTDFSIGTPIAGRARAETETLIGFFVNTLVMRTDHSGDPTFRELLGRVRQTALGAYSHQDMPFAKLVQELNPERRLGNNPLFEVMFNLWNVPQKVIEFRGLQASEVEFDRSTAQFELSLDMAKTPDGLLCVFEYFAELFEEATVVRMAQHFKTLLAGIVERPDSPLSALPLLTDAEWHQLLVEWNDTQAEFPRDLCVHQLFEAQVERTPDAIAVVFGRESLSYRELNQRANQLARYLRAKGVGPEILVGICLERSPEMMISLLAVLKAGGAYVPLDPAYPAERLTFMLEDTRAPVLLTQARLKDRLPRHTAHVVCVDADWNAITQEDAGNLSVNVWPDNLAYLIYTSGSTGVPKGVQISHHAVVNHNQGVAHTYHLCSSDRVLQFASISFDVAAEELFPSWSSGACVVLWPDQALESFIDFTRWVAQQQLTVLNLPASFWQEWIGELSHSQTPLPTSLRLVVTGSEPVSAEKFVLWKKLAGDRVNWFNAYGPTEATITCALYQPAAHPAQPETGWMPIGRPVANTQVYVLDAHLQPVPIGVPGELHIGGVCVARGYLNRPELTKDKFARDPFRSEGAARIYKTGDLVRYRSDGNLEFLGRVDNQVKVRGFRIELGEIEAVLGQHPAVREAVVVAREDQPGEKRLVAYLVVKQQPAPSVDDFRDFLKERLPDYMVPSAFVFIEALPLTPNGKVNRQALPAPDKTRPELQSTFVAPRTPTEETLTRIWTQILGVEPIGVHDNFFELGGHSLLATQVISRLRDVLHVELPLRNLFEAMTVAELAERLDNILWAASDQHVAGNLADDREEIEL